MFIINIHSKGHEQEAQQFICAMSAIYTLHTSGICDVLWLRDMFTDELASAARVSKTELTDEKFSKWFACMNDMFGPDYVRNGILEVLKQRVVQGVNLLLVADADFTPEYASAFEFWPKTARQHTVVTFIHGDQGLFIKKDEIRAGVQAVLGVMQRRD